MVNWRQTAKIIEVENRLRSKRCEKYQVAKGPIIGRKRTNREQARSRKVRKSPTLAILTTVVPIRILEGGCDRRIEVFVTKKKLGGGGRGRVGGGVRVNVIEELKFLGKFTKKKKFFFGGGGMGGGGGWVGGRGRVGGGVRVDVIEELKFLGKFPPKKFVWGGGVGLGVRVDVIEEN